jgi:hypothetical protein
MNALFGVKNIDILAARTVGLGRKQTDGAPGKLNSAGAVARCKIPLETLHTFS